MGISGVADYQSVLEIKKFNIVDPIWRTKMQKVLYLDENRYLVAVGFTDYVSKIQNRGP